MAIQTPKLHLLLIQENWKFADDSFNLVIADMDNKLLGVGHADSKVHWDGWKTGYSYSKGDVIRIDNGKSNQYYLCVTNGISGVAEPTNNITGSVVDDGTVQWKVCIIGDSEGNAAVDIFRGGMAYTKGQLVLYNEVLYRCKVAHIAAMTMELDEDKWQQVDASLQPWKASVYFFQNDIVVYDNVIYKCKTAHTSGYTFDDTKWEPLNITLINDWETSKKYLQNQVVLYEGILFRALDTHTSDSTDFGNDVSTHWEYICAELPEWGANISYVVGQIVLYNNRLYKCTTAHVSTSTFDNTKWTSIFALPILEDWQVSTVYVTGQLVLNAGNLYRANQDHTSDSTSILADIAKWDLVYASISDWDDAIDYKVGQLVIYNNKLYRCTASHLSTSTFDSTKWESIVSFPVIEEWQVDTSYLENQVVKYNDLLLIAIDSHISDSTDIANDLSSLNMHWNLLFANIESWQVSTVYKIGTQVIYQNNLYQCKNTHTSGSAFVDANWELIGQADAFIYEWQDNKYYRQNQVVVHDKEIWVNNTTHTSASTWAADETNWTKISSETTVDNWASSTQYLNNQFVIYNGVLYRCITPHTSTSTFDSAKFEPVNANIVNWKTSTEYIVGNLVVYNNQLYKCLIAHTSTSTFEADGAKWQPIANNIAGIPAWASGIYYYENQVVKYNGKIWRCLTAHTSGVNDSPDNVIVYEKNQSHFFEINMGTPLPAEYILDIGSVNPITKIRLNGSNSGIDIYGKIYISIDGTNYIDVGDFSAGNHSGSGPTINLYANARYIKIQVTSRFDGYGYGGSVYFSQAIVNGPSTKWEIIVDDGATITYWEQGQNYDVNDIVIYNDELYRCIEKHASGSTFDITKWLKISETTIKPWDANVYYKVNQVVTYNGSMWRIIVAHTSDTNNKPDEKLVYESNSNIVYTDDTTIIPNTEVVDLGSVYDINRINITAQMNELGFSELLTEVSEDGVNWEKWNTESAHARYIRFTVTQFTPAAGATNPYFYIDSLRVYTNSPDYEEISTMNTLDDNEIDEMFI